MRILFLYPYLPAPSAGHGSARLVSELLAELKQKVEITLVCGFRPKERSLVEAVRPFCHRLLAVERPFAADLSVLRRFAEKARTAAGLLTTRLPSPVLKLRRRAFARAVDQALAGAAFDVAHIEHSAMAHYVHRLPCDLNTVLVDYEAAGPEGGEASRWKHFVSSTYTRFSKVVTLSDEDRNELKRLDSRLDIAVRPVGIAWPTQGHREPKSDRLLFVGSPGHAPNSDALRWLATEIYPALKKLHPTARLLVAGMPKDDSELTKVALAAGVEFLGFVDDLASEFAQATAFIAPLREGRGVRIKVLEAMAHGVPVITTPLGLQGLPTLTPHVTTVNSTDAFATATAAILKNPAQAFAATARAQDLLRVHHHPAAQAHFTLRLWQSLAARKNHGH